MILYENMIGMLRGNKIRHPEIISTSQDMATGIPKMMTNGNMWCIQKDGSLHISEKIKLTDKFVHIRNCIVWQF